MSRFVKLALLFSAVLLILAITVNAAEDLKASRERLCGSNSDCLTVVVVEEVPDDGKDEESTDPDVVAALKAQEAKDAVKGTTKDGKKIKRVSRSFLKIDKLNFKTDTVIKMVKNMPEWFGPRPSKFIFRGKEVSISKRLSRFNPRLNEKIIMMKADLTNDDKDIVVPNEANDENRDL